MSTVTLYGTQGCHLCDLAELLLRHAQAARPFDWHYVDIALDPLLVERYGTLIPILKVEGQALLRWPFSLLDVMRVVTPV